MLASLEQRASKLLETLDEKTSAKIGETRAAAPSGLHGSDVSTLLGGRLMSAAAAGAPGVVDAPADPAASPSLAPSTPARSSGASLTPTPATVLPADGSQAAPPHDAVAAAAPAQRKEQLALLAADLQVVLQHGHALHARLQKEGMGRQTLALRVRELERAREDDTERAAEREAALRAQLSALEAREASVRAQVGRGHDERRLRDEEVRALEGRLKEHATLASTAAAEGERLRGALAAQASALAAVRDDLESSQRELAALQAAKLERERQLDARGSALEARAAELATALSAAARAADGRAADLVAAMAALDGARADAARERAAREAAEAASARAAAELAETVLRAGPAREHAAGEPTAADDGGESDAGAHSRVAAVAAELEGTRAELAASEARGRALEAELVALRAETADAARVRGSGARAQSSDELLLRTLGGEGAPASDTERLRAQLEQMGARLSEQHELVTQLRSDRAALQLELDAETKRRRLAEQLGARKPHADADSLESGGGVGDGFSPAQRMQLKRRWAHRPNVARVMEVVDEAAQLLDRGSLHTTRFLSHNPYVRLVVACYVLLLHLWVLVVLMHVAPGSRSRAHSHAHPAHMLRAQSVGPGS